MAHDGRYRKRQAFMALKNMMQMKMKTMKTTIIPAMTVLAMALSGCDGKNNPEISGSGTISFVLRSEGTLPGEPDDRINTVTAYRIADGVLKEVLEPANREKPGVFTFSPESMSGTMYVTANLDAVQSLGEAAPGMAEEEFLSLAATAAEMTDGGIGMTGKADLKTGGTGTLAMRRSVARLDLQSRESGVRVLKAGIKGFADVGRIFPGMAASEEDRADAGDIVLDFSGTPVENDRRTLMYLPEQSGSVITAEVTVSSNGGTSILRASLPDDILRNNLYTLEVHGNGAEMMLEVTCGDWESGGASGSVQMPGGIVDVENSVLPTGVKISSGRDTVYVTYQDVAFELALLAGASSQVTVDGLVEGVEIERLPETRNGFVRIAGFSVKGSHRMPGMAAGRLHLDIHEGEMHTGRVVLVFAANPVKISGLLSIGPDGSCDFGRYVDGEIGTLTLPQGKRLSMEFPESSPAWMKAAVSENGPEGTVYRILGGWRPNDPDADGRTQEGYIVITDADGSGRETYTVKRKNWGLPVVQMGETWWTLYNLRGDARSFEDQVTCGNAPAAGESFMETLLAMPDESLAEIMGDQYQAGSTAGLPLVHDGNAFLYDGMKTSAADFGTTAPESMAPPGYRIPSYDDFAFLSGSDNYNIGGVGERSYTGMTGETITVRIAERDIAMAGHEYGTVAFYEFTSGDNVWVLYGPGHQWNTTPGNIARMHILMATSGTAGMSWAMEGYASTDRPGQNWLKFTAHNNTKTRIIRCVKTPVEYIY